MNIQEILADFKNSLLCCVCKRMVDRTAAESHFYAHPFCGECATLCKGKGLCLCNGHAEDGPLPLEDLLFQEEKENYGRPSPPPTPQKPSAVSVVIALSSLTSDQATLIYSSHEGLGAHLEVEIVVTEDVSLCHYLIVDANAEELCSRTERYVEALVRNKKIVSFSWYLSLMGDTPLPPSKCIVLGDTSYGSSPAPHLSFFFRYPRPFFQDILFWDEFSSLSPCSSLVLLVKEHGGVITDTKTEKSIPISSLDGLYDFISKGHPHSSDFLP